MLAFCLLYGPAFTAACDYWEDHNLDILNYIGRVLSLLFNTLPRFVITFLSRKNCLLISEEQREAKSKRERERYIQLNAEFQRTARRDKKAFFIEQCLIIEENNKRKKTRDLFRKIGNIEGAFCPKMCTIRDKNGRDLVDVEKIKKRWNEYTELCRKDLGEPYYYYAVVSHPEPDILGCEVKWALRSAALNKARGCDEIPGELFKSLKEDAIKVLHSLCQQIWKTQHLPQDWTRSILIPIPKKGNTKERANHQTIALIPHAIKVMLKILHARLNIM